MTNKPLQIIANPVMQSRTRFLALQTLGPVFKRASRSFTQFSIVVLGPKLEFSLQPRVQATHSKQPFLWLSACCAEIRGHLFAHPFWFSSRGLSLFSGSNQVNTLWTHALQFTRLKELYSHLVLQQSNNLTFLVIELLGARNNPNFVQHVWLRQWRRNLKKLWCGPCLTPQRPQHSTQTFSTPIFPTISTPHLPTTPLATLGTKLRPMLSPTLSYNAPPLLSNFSCATLPFSTKTLLTFPCNPLPLRLSTTIFPTSSKTSPHSTSKTTSLQQASQQFSTTLFANNLKYHPSLRL